MSPFGSTRIPPFDIYIYRYTLPIGETQRIPSIRWCEPTRLTASRSLSRGPGTLTVDGGVTKSWGDLWEGKEEKGETDTTGWDSLIIWHPWRLTWNMEHIIIMEVWKIMFLSTWVICGFHVNLPRCMYIVWIYVDYYRPSQYAIVLYCSY